MGHLTPDKQTVDRKWEANTLRLTLMKIYIFIDLLTGRTLQEFLYLYICSSAPTLIR